MTTTACGTFQSAGVNVKEGTESEPSFVLLTLSGTVTAAAGALDRAIVKVAWPPAWVVNSLFDPGVTTKPA